MVAAGILMVDLADDEVKAGTLCTFPIAVGERNYMISVRSNHSVSEASYFGLLSLFRLI